jgi:hypothetical protein
MLSLASSTLWRPAHYRRPFRRCESTASFIGTAASCRTHRQKPFSTTIRERTPSFSLCICGIQPGQKPETMADVFNRQKDIQYSSRIATHIARQQQTHGLRHVISELLAQLPEHERRKESIKELAAYGCPTRMHVVRLLAPMLERENHTKDIDFSASGINSAGKQATPIRNRCFSNARGRASSTHSKGSSCMLAMSLCLSRQSRSPVTLLPAREAWIARGSLPNSSLPCAGGAWLRNAIIRQRDLIPSCRTEARLSELTAGVRIPAAALGTFP